jgi:adenylate kinase
LKKIRLVVTGNPGVGKHTVSKVIAKKIGAEIIDINKVAVDNNVIAGKKTDRGLDVDVKKLSKLLEKMLDAERIFVLVGHLAPYVLEPTSVSWISVLRRSPYELENTLRARGYSIDKVRENLASEILGISLYDSLKTFGKGKVAQFDTTYKTPEQTADEILLVASAQKKPTENLQGIDWLILVSEKGDMQRFFNY